MFWYIFLTWILANVLHPFAAAIYFSFYPGEMGSDVASEAMFFFVFGLIFSLPSLLLGYLFVLLRGKVPFQRGQRFGIWIFMASVTLTLNLMLLSIFFLESPVSLFEDPYWLNIVMPSTIAVFFTVLVRYNYFLKLFDQTSATSQSS